MPEGARLLRVGVVRRPHGLRGEVTAESVGDFPERLSPGSRLTAVVNGEALEVTVEAARPHGSRVLLRFEGRDSREAAERLSGADLYADRADLTRPSGDFLFDDEVAGFHCVSLSGEALGRAVAFEKHGENCCLRVDRRGRAFLVPFTHPIVREVSREDRRIVLDPPDGLFEL